MHKTKLGISVALMGSIICFLGLILGLQWVFLGIIAYVLLMEENEWLRKTALKVLIVLFVAATIPYILSIVDYIFLFVNRFLANFTDDNILKWPFDIDLYIMDVVKIAKICILVIMGLKALKQEHFAIGKIDKIINKNI